MTAILVWWFALPPLARRLTRDAVVLAVLALLALGFIHRRERIAYANGYRKGTDSTELVSLQHQAVTVANVERRADSLSSHALDSLTAFFAKQARSQPHIARIEPIPIDSSGEIKTVPLSDFVKVYVESDSMAYLVEPRAATIWAAEDSALTQAIVMLTRMRDALIAEHQARIGADSLAVAWRDRSERLEQRPAVTETKGRSKVHVVAEAVLWAGLGFIAARHIR